MNATMTSVAAESRSSGSISTPSQSSAPRSSTDVPNHSVFAAGSDSRAIGLAMTANAGRYLN